MVFHEFFEQWLFLISIFQTTFSYGYPFVFSEENLIFHPAHIFSYLWVTSYRFFTHSWLQNLQIQYNQIRSLFTGFNFYYTQRL